MDPVKPASRMAVTLSKRLPSPSIDDPFGDCIRSVVTVVVDSGAGSGVEPTAEFWELSVDRRTRKSSFRSLSRDEAFSRFANISRSGSSSVVE